MKLGRLLFVVVMVIFILTIFGKRGIVDNYKLRDRLTELKRVNQAQTLENLELRRKADLLKDDLTYIEKTARQELGMVRPGDLIYRITQ